MSTIPYRLKWTKYIPHKPTAKQLAFLMLPHREALYGGAAGGGKSEALLMGALQYVDVPGYAAIIFRKTLADLKMPKALIDRSHEWLDNTDATWVPSEHCWYFPTVDHEGRPSAPAKLQFGYIGESAAHLRYQGIEVQYCAFDELTQHNESDYTYLFSRLRRNVCIFHTERDAKGNPIYVPDCPLCIRMKNLPLRMRAATNPGGPGHRWVQDRFCIRPEVELSKAKLLGIRPKYLGFHPERPFVPSFLTDNPYLDQKSYEEGLEELGHVERMRLKYGDWGVSPDSRFKPEWLRYYSIRGSYITLGPNGTGEAIEIRSLQKIFACVDPAGSSKQGPADEVTGYKRSWTVIGVFGVTQDYNLLWLDLLRFRKEIPDIVAKLREVYATWKPEYLTVEQNGLGKGVFQLALKVGLPVKPITRSSDKVVHSTDAQVRMEQGRIWIPQNAVWRKIVEDELLSWSGHPDESDDIVDCLSDAAKDVSWQAAVVERYQDDNPIDDLASYTPSVIAANHPLGYPAFSSFPIERFL